MEYIHYTVSASKRRADAPELRCDKGLVVSGVCQSYQDPLALALKQVPHLRHYDRFTVSVCHAFFTERATVKSRTLADIKKTTRELNASPHERIGDWLKNTYPETYKTKWKKGGKQNGH